MTLKINNIDNYTMLEINVITNVIATGTHLGTVGYSMKRALPSFASFLTNEKLHFRLSTGHFG